LGHHIRSCKKLEEKNRCNKVRENPVCRIRVDIPSVSKPVASKPQNSFASLYSSDDEVEEGEIVEDRTERISHISASDSESAAASGVEKEWTRSGVKGVHIKMVDTSSSSSDDENLVCDYEAMAESLAALSAYVDKFRGRSWADIEYDSE
jgi:hypothetical protein